MFEKLTSAFRRAPEGKDSRARWLVALHAAGKPVWTPRDYAALAREGYMSNAIVHRAVRLVAEAAGSVPLTALVDGREISEHPLLTLLRKPNARQSGPAFLEALVGHLMVAGNAYVEASVLDGEVRELHALRPDRMRVVPGSDGWPEGWDYTVGAQTLHFSAEGLLPPILHLALFHPLDDHYGLSPLEAAAVAVDTHNAAAAWNKALLDNAARPSGALVYAGPDGGNLTDEQYIRLKDELESQFQGAANAGRPLLLDGGLDWRPMGLTPKDMDFLEAKNAAAREIALAFGVPPMLLGLPGDNTYANYAEANRALWRQTVLPLLGRVLGDVAQWLAPAFGEVRLESDLDRIEVLSAEREALWRRIDAATFLSDEEKREAVGYGNGIHGGEA